MQERGKSRVFKERGTICDEIEVSPLEFAAYCNALQRRDFSIDTLDRCARAKALSARARFRSRR